MSDVVQRAKVMKSTIALTQSKGINQAYPDQTIAKMLDDMLAEIERLTPRRIESVSELAILSNLSVVQFCGTGLGDKNRLVWQLDEEWFSPGSPWCLPHDAFPEDAFPAFVLFTPDAAS